MLNLITRKTDGGRGTGVRVSQYSVTGAGAVNGHGMIQSNAALYHNFGCFVTGRAPVLPFDSNLTAHVTSRVTACFSRAVWVVLMGLLAGMVFELLLATDSWWQVESRLLADSPVLNQAAMVTPTAVADPAHPLLQAAVGLNLKQALAADDRSAVALPAIGDKGMKYTWFRQIEDWGRIMYEAVPDRDGMPLTEQGPMNFE